MKYNFPFKVTDKILELGGGTVPVFRPNLDVRKAENVDIVADFNEVLPVEDNQYDGIFSKFCIEHISWRKVKKFLEEVFRILKDQGTAVFITANTERQMEWVLEHDDWDHHCSCIIFGDQDYVDNTHRNSLNPKYAIQLMREVGFSSVVVIPYGDLGTDMLIEATKGEFEIKDIGENLNTNNKTTTERQDLFDSEYFSGGGKVGGYAYEGYWDFPVHWLTFNKLMQLKPESVLEIGCARGYLVKRFEAAGISAKGLEISKHCQLTRVTDSVIEWDMCQTPWPFKDKEFDLCYSVAVMEHIPEQYLPAITSEIDRVSKRGLHGVDFGENDDGFDKTHCTLHDQSWWENQFSKTQKICNKEDLEQGSLAIEIPAGDEKLKLNIGSFTVMFHNGWVNMDIAELQQFANMHHYKFIHMDARNPLRLNDNTVDLIVSSHMLEHLNLSDGIKFLRECYRVMKPGATLRLSVPDCMKIIDYYQNNKLQKFDDLNVVSRQTPLQSYKLWSLLFEGHAIAYDWESLKAVGEAAGFKVYKRAFNEGHSQIIQETFDFLPDLSIYIELVKK